MTRLPQLQDAFQRFLLGGDASISADVLGTQRVPVETRLGIYGDGYSARLIESLQATYPVLAELLGETDFERVASKYVAAHQSTFFSIRFYGDQMARFLATDPDYARAPLLAELAAWEWAMAAVFDAADAEPIDVDAFAQVPPEHWSHLSFRWSPSVHVLELEWNVPALWKAVTEQAERPELSLNALGSWLLWRRDLQIFFRPLATQEAEIMAASRAGQSFGELCVLLCSYFDEQQASLQAAGLLRGWVQSGLIVSADLPSQ